MTDKKLLNKLSRYLVANNETVSVAESVTGGMLQAVFASMNDAEKFFQGGITAYNIGQKARHLHVEPIHASKYNCVSEKVACEMAVNAGKLFQSIWSIAITGYVTAVPESGNKIFAYYAIAKEGIIQTEGRIIPRLKDPAKIKAFYIDAILQSLLKMTG